MRLGVFSVLYSQLPFEEALDRFRGMGLDAVEVGCGNYPGEGHCKPAELLADETRLTAFRREVGQRDRIISALSQHGDPVHTDRELQALKRQLVKDRSP